MKKLLLATCFTALTIGTGLPKQNNTPAEAAQEPAAIAAEFGKYIPEYQELKNQLLASGLSEEKAENATRTILFSRHPEFRGLLEQVKGLLGQTAKTKRSGLLIRCCKGTWNFLKRHKGFIATAAALVSLYYLAHLINDHHSIATGKIADDILSQGVGSFKWMAPTPCTLNQQPEDVATIIDPEVHFSTEQAAQNVKALGVAGAKLIVKGTDIAGSFILSQLNAAAGLAQQTGAYKWAESTAVPAFKAAATTAYNFTQPYLKAGCSYLINATHWLKKQVLTNQELLRNKYEGYSILEV
ncbi:MAG: hypothetical protein WC365_04510 [Candidatus Babeliales bacterium]|jgi:hypothetical protein